MPTTLIAIGGAIHKENPSVMREFILRAGQDQARIVTLPQASSLADTGSFYAQTFLELGAASSVAFEFRHRSEAGTAEQLDLLRQATGIFIAGGTQMRLPILFSGTPLEVELMNAYRRGCVIAGTSAGAAVLSRTMIAYGKGGATPREGIVQFSPGFGFTERFVFDMHFRQRDRLGRLIYAVAACPGVLGLGVDENTAAIVEDDETITVCGSGAVTVLDASQLTVTDLADVDNRRPVAVAGLRLHILTSGCAYDWKTQTAHIPEKALLLE